MSYVKLASTTGNTGGLIFSAENIANIRLYNAAIEPFGVDLVGMHVYYSHTPAFYSASQTLNGNFDLYNVMVLIIKPSDGSNFSENDLFIVQEAVLESSKTSNTPFVRLSKLVSIANTRYTIINLSNML